MNQADVGVVVIGRNEGERLRACLTSLRDIEAKVYVDSGSTDGSCALARSLGFEVIDLDMSRPFSAARARNTGINWLTRARPGLEFVQVVDGDCEVRDGWIETALADHATDPRRAVVFGRRRERHPDRNAYHMACDDEWNVPTGDVNSCGGDALLRVAAIAEIGGYPDDLIAGEEPDMCLRLRGRNWRIWSNGREMTWHDVDMDRLGQWWKRCRRSGFSFSELLNKHGQNADPAWRRLVRSALGWTAINLLALLGIALAIFDPGPVSLAVAALPASLSLLQVGRMAWSKRRFGPWRALQWSGLMMIAKAAQTKGWLQYKSQAITRRRATLIEYKS